MREMKDSGIAWIGEIPREWGITRVKSYFSHHKIIAGENADNYERLALTLNGVIRRSKDDNEGLQPEEFRGYQILDENELVFKLIDLANVKTSRVGLSPYLGIVSPAYIILHNDRKDNKFFYWWFMFMYYNEIFNQLGDNGVRSALNAKDLLCLPIVNIDERKQHLISSYLDAKCSEIDSALSLQEQMISELRAYKQSLITETVTHGLNPNAKMKNSGVECVGFIPEHWDMILLPFVFNNMDYLREPISADKRSRNNPIYDYYGASGVIDKIDFYNVKDEVLLIGEDGANLRMRNLPLIYKAKGKFWVNNHAHILKPIRDDYDYMAYMLESLDYNNYITGSAQPKLSQDNLSKVKVCVPPLSEQRSIATFLDEKCAEIDALIALREKKMEALKEYKKSLIYECVTGKKQVI